LTLTATFGLSYILINIAQQSYGADVASVPYLSHSLTIGSLRFPESLLVGFAMAVAITVLLSIWLTATRAGVALRATAQNTAGAQICGINAVRVRLLGFGLSAALAAAAGTLLVIVQPISPQGGTSLTLLAFVVIALGGLGNYQGAAVGALVVGVGQTYAGYEFGSIAQAAVPYVLLLLIMLTRPEGLLKQKVA
jgi:branched-chain amino acid transport system permease protein